MGKAPLIGITAGVDPQLPGHYILRWDYVHAVCAAGGIPVILAPGAAAERDDYIAHFEALLFSGGGDIRPEVYGQTPHVTVRDTSRARDAFEMRLMKEALARGLPLLGICRGMQLLNVVLGGDLIQDIPSDRPSPIAHDDLTRPRDVFVHHVTLSEDSRLHACFEATDVQVNSFHHQAVSRVGDGLEPVGFSEDGLIEALELRDARFVVGVQWHPETFWKREVSCIAPIGALVNAAS